MKAFTWRVIRSLCLAGLALGLVAGILKSEIKQEMTPETLLESRRTPQYFSEKTGGKAVRDTTDTIWYENWPGTIIIWERDTLRTVYIVPAMPDSGKFWIPSFGNLRDQTMRKYFQGGMKVRFSGYQKWECGLIPSYDPGLPIDHRLTYMRTVITDIEADR
jgi:hypothetical protein